MNEIDRLAGIAASLAETAEKLAAILAQTEYWFSGFLLARREGYEAGLADARPQPRSKRDHLRPV